jgi:hypothetical protein
MSRLSLPLRRVLRRLPLPLTATTVLLLLVIPSLVLWRWPRPRAQGLEQLMASASLLQSFPASPDRPVPALWRQRFGDDLALRLWREQRRQWWQFWGSHADLAPFLAVQDTGDEGSRKRLPANALRVGNLLVVAPDPLARRLLKDQLRPEQRPGRGLFTTCVARLENDQAVFWNATAVGALLGPVAPLLEAYQEGCLSLALEPLGVRWQGEAAAVDGGTAMNAPAAGLDPPPPRQPPLPVDLLLELQGTSLDQLLQGLLSRQLIRDPLAARYGIDTQGIALLRRSPFRLRLLPQASGPFQASLELQVAVGKDRPGWDQLLARLARSLRQQGLEDGPPAPLTQVPSPRPGGSPIPASPVTRISGQGTMSWRRGDGVVLGGWRWIAGSPGDQLLFFLGPVPSREQPMASGPAQSPRDGELWLRVRPQALDLLGLLPSDMPDLVRRADQLWIDAAPVETMATPESGAPGRISRLRGRLRVIR